MFWAWAQRDKDIEKAQDRMAKRLQDAGISLRSWIKPRTRLKRMPENQSDVRVCAPSGCQSPA